MTIIDFTSALYLGFQHGSSSLRPWTQLTSGRPAVMGLPTDHGKVAESLARLVGCDSGVMGTSTLHLFTDLFGMFARSQTAIYVDSGAYPIGIRAALGCGIPIHRFRHHDTFALQQLLDRDSATGRIPLVLADGLCPGCGRVAPLAAYSNLIERHRGYLILDDTQALGILGMDPDGRSPYGQCGGGSLCQVGVQGSRIIVVSSLAKGFGVPVATLNTSEDLLAFFNAQSETRVHCSPPSIAVIRATEHALILNRHCGEALRIRLAQLVQEFRRRLTAVGCTFSGYSLPIQTLRLPAEVNAVLLHSSLLRRGICTVLHQSRCKRRTAISFLITLLHRFADFDDTAIAMKDIFRQYGIATSARTEAQHELALADRTV